MIAIGGADTQGTGNPADDDVADWSSRGDGTRNPDVLAPGSLIVSIDTLKSARYRRHLQQQRWDAVVIDESHNLANSATLNNQLARIAGAATPRR